MAKVTVTTNRGVVVDQFDTTEYNLKKNMARADLAAKILDAIEWATEEDKKDDS